MVINGWLRHTVLAVTVGVVAVCMANAEADRGTAAGGHRGTAATDSVVRWQVAGTLRGELLAMLAAAERGDAVTASGHAAGAATEYRRMSDAMAVVAPEVDRVIAAELQALTLLDGPEPARRALARGRVLGSLAAGAHAGAVSATQAGAAAEAEEWLALREYRQSTRVTMVHSAAAQAVRRMAGGELAPEAATAIVRDDLDDTYHARLHYAATRALQAAERSLVSRAAESAGLVSAYLMILGNDFAAKLGSDTRAELGAAELAPRIAAVDAAEAEQLEQILAELTGHVTHLGPVPRVRELSAAGQAIVAATLGTSGTIDGDSVFTVIGQLLDSVDSAVRNGEWEVAERTRIQAYGLFDAGPELSLLALDPPLAALIDGLFWSGAQRSAGLATVIAAQAPFPQYLAAAGDLRGALVQAQGVLSRDAAPLAVAVNAALIVFREGLEAVVILAALVASLVGATAVFRRPLYLGAAAALVASAATGVAARMLVHSFRMLGERLEAIVSLVAIAVLLLITNWFFHKVYWSGWIAKFHGHKRTLLAGVAGQAIGFALLGFVSVYREGFETALFLQALFLRASTDTVLAGVLLGGAAVAAVGVATLYLEKKLPHKKMLVVTGVLISTVLITLVGATVHVMQAVLWIPVTPIIGLTLPYWLGNWFGIYPTWQTCIAQVAAVTFVLGSYYTARLRVRRGASRSAPMSGAPLPRRVLAGGGS